MNESPIRPQTVAALCLTEFCILVALAIPHIVGLPLRVREIESGLSLESRLSWVESTAVLSALITNPVAGWLSDRSVRRAGHRAQWIAGGAFVGGLAMVASTYTSDLPGLVATWAVAQVSFSVIFAALYGTLSDVVPPSDRARAASWFAASALGAVAFGGLLAAGMLTEHVKVGNDHVRSAFVVAALLTVPIALLSAWHLSRVTLQAPGTRQRGSKSYRGPSKDGVRRAVGTLGAAGAPYWWLWLQRFLAQASYVCFAVYGVFFITRRIGVVVDNAALLLAMSTTAGAIAGVVAAVWGAPALVVRLGLRRVMASGLALLATANFILALTSDVPVFVAAHLCAGTGLGLFFAVDLAAVLAVLPSGMGGRFLGFFHFARALPGAIVPAVGPALLAIGTGDVTGADRTQNYFALMVFGGGLAVTAFLLTGRLLLPGESASWETAGRSDK